MKKALLLFAIGLCLVAAAYAANMSGTWVLDPAKSDQMGGGRQGGAAGAAGGAGQRGGGGGAAEITIAQTATEFSITRTQGGNPSETKYTTDGAEHTLSTQRGDTKYKAVWSGDILTISGTRAGRNGDTPFKEAYSVSADGKVLTIASTRQGQDGETTTKQVYNKK
jgi:hypothetical protein